MDSSWEFIGNEEDDYDPEYDCDADYEGDNVPSVQWPLGWVIKVDLEMDLGVGGHHLNGHRSNYNERLGSKR